MRYCVASCIIIWDEETHSIYSLGSGPLGRDTDNYHPELYQDKFKRHVNMAQADESDDSGEEQEVAVAEWTRGANPVPCKWVKQQGLVKGFDFDVTKAEQIFDLLLKEKQLKLPENHKLPTAQELQGRLYCKWHHSFTHATGECKELRRQIQLAIEQGQLILAQHTMKVDTKPFPQANMVELSDFRSEGPGFGIPSEHGGTHVPP